MIHPTAVIEFGAKIGNNVKIGPYSCIGCDVTLGDDCVVGPHVVITGYTICGKGNRFYQFSSIGEAPQDLKYQGERTRLVIGDNNTFRENSTVHRGTVQDKEVTQIGSNCLFMAYTHVGHDSTIGDDVIFSNGATVAGHVNVGDWAILSGGVSVHQFCNIGTHAFVGGHAGVSQDIVPFVLVSGTPASPSAINIEGMKRRGFSKEDVAQARRAYKTIFRQSLMLSQAKDELAGQVETSGVVSTMLAFINASKRGLAR